MIVPVSGSMKSLGRASPLASPLIVVNVASKASTAGASEPASAAPVAITRNFTSSGVSDGSSSSIKATVPETTAAEAEVPVSRM